MVDEVDHHLGRLIDYMTANNLLENTIVVFLSDNGAEGHSLDALFPEAVFLKQESGFWARFSTTTNPWAQQTLTYFMDPVGAGQQLPHSGVTKPTLAKEARACPLLLASQNA